MNIHTVTLLWILLNMKTVKTSSCGQLIAIPEEVSLFTQTALYMTFAHDGNSVNSLWHRPVDGQAYVFVDRSQYEEVPSSTRPLSVLKIPRSLYKHSGTYKVLCGDGTYSTETRVTIKMFPPSAPVFNGVETIGSCNKCLPAWAGQPLDVSCSTWNGTQPVTMEIRKRNVVVPDIKTKFLTFNEFSGHVTFEPSDNEHMAELLCYVRNAVSPNALITTTKLYIKRLPNTPVIGSPWAVEGETSNISCSSNGGRPAPTVTFTYNGTAYHVVPAVIIPSHDAYYVEATFKQAFLSRYDNRRVLKCCTKVSQDVQSQCTSEKLIVYFPPLTVELKALHEKIKTTENKLVVLQCTVGESFPTSEIEWRGLSDLRHNISKTYLQQGMYGSVEIYQAVTIFLTRSDNGHKVSCLAKNKGFINIKKRDSYVLNVTYAPEITFIPSVHVTVSPGDDVTVTCIVDSNPPSTIHWYNGSRIIGRSDGGTPNEASLYIDAKEVIMNGSVFSCHASNGVGAGVRRDIIITLTDKSFDKLQGGGGENDETSAIVAVVICLLLIVVIATVVGILWFRRKSKLAVELRPDVLRIHIEERQPSVTPPVNNEPVYSNVNYNEKVNTTESEKLSPEETSEKVDTAGQKELVYAELDLDVSRKPSIPSTEPESETQYVAIDFTKRAET